MNQFPHKREVSHSPDRNTNFFRRDRGRQAEVGQPSSEPKSQPAYPILSSRQILPTSLPPKTYFASRQRSTSREQLSTSKKFLNLVHDGAKFCLVQGDAQNSQSDYEALGYERDALASTNKGSWPFRSQSFDRASYRRSIHLCLPEDEDSSQKLGDQPSENLDEVGGVVKDAHIRKLTDIQDILKASTAKKQSSSYVSKGSSIPQYQTAPSLDYPVFFSKPSESGSHEQSLGASQGHGYNITPFSNKDSGMPARQFGFGTSITPCPSSSYGVHRRSRSSAVLLRAKKFESKLQQQQQQQQSNQNHFNSMEQVNPAIRTLPWSATYTSPSYQVPLKPRRDLDMPNLHKTCSSPSIFAMAGETSWRRSAEKKVERNSDIYLNFRHPQNPPKDTTSLCESNRSRVCSNDKLSVDIGSSYLQSDSRRSSEFNKNNNQIENSLYSAKSMDIYESPQRTNFTESNSNIFPKRNIYIGPNDLVKPYREEATIPNTFNEFQKSGSTISNPSANKRVEEVSSFNYNTVKAEQYQDPGIESSEDEDEDTEVEEDSIPEMEEWKPEIQKDSKVESKESNTFYERSSGQIIDKWKPEIQNDLKSESKGSNSIYERSSGQIIDTWKPEIQNDSKSEAKGSNSFYERSSGQIIDKWKPEIQNNSKAESKGPSTLYERSFGQNTDQWKPDFQSDSQTVEKEWNTQNQISSLIETEKLKLKNQNDFQTDWKSQSVYSQPESNRWKCDNQTEPVTNLSFANSQSNAYSKPEIEKRKPEFQSDSQPNLEYVNFQNSRPQTENWKTNTEKEPMQQKLQTWETDIKNDSIPSMNKPPIPERQTGNGLDKWKHNFQSKTSPESDEWRPKNELDSRIKLDKWKQEIQNDSKSSVEMKRKSNTEAEGWKVERQTTPENKDWRINSRKSSSPFLDKWNPAIRRDSSPLIEKWKLGNRRDSSPFIDKWKPENQKDSSPFGEKWKKENQKDSSPFRDKWKPEIQQKSSYQLNNKWKPVTSNDPSPTVETLKYENRKDSIPELEDCRESNPRMESWKSLIRRDSSPMLDSPKSDQRKDSIPELEEWKPENRITYPEWSPQINSYSETPIDKWKMEYQSGASLEIEEWKPEVENDLLPKIVDNDTRYEWTPEAENVEHSFHNQRIEVSDPLGDYQVLQVESFDQEEDEDSDPEVEEILSKTPQNVEETSPKRSNLRAFPYQLDLTRTPNSSDKECFSREGATVEQEYEGPIVRRDNSTEASYAARIKLKSRSRSGSKTSSENDESKRSNEAVQYKVSIKLQAQQETSPKETRSRFVDIKLTDCSKGDDDGEEQVKIPVLHFSGQDEKTEETSSHVAKRPTSLRISPPENNGRGWRCIPIEKVDKSPNFEVPSFPQSTLFQKTPDEIPKNDDLDPLKIEELTGSEESSLADPSKCHVEVNDQEESEHKATLETTPTMPKNQRNSYVDFEELSDVESSESIEEEAAENVERSESGDDDSGGEKKQSEHDGDHSENERDLEDDDDPEKDQDEEDDQSGYEEDVSEYEKDLSIDGVDREQDKEKLIHEQGQFEANFKPSNLKKDRYDDDDDDSQLPDLEQDPSIYNELSPEKLQTFEVHEGSSNIDQDDSEYLNQINEKIIAISEDFPKIFQENFENIQNPDDNSSFKINESIDLSECVEYDKEEEEPDDIKIKDKAVQEKEDHTQGEDDDDSFATCSSELSDPKKDKDVSNEPNQEVENRKTDLQIWDSADIKTEVDVSDIEEEEEDIPDIETLGDEIKQKEDFVLASGEEPKIVHKYLARLEKEMSETESEDESFEAFRARRIMNDREAAPPERDINEDDTETAEFQTKLRQLGSNTSSSSATQREAFGDHSPGDATTPDVSAATMSVDLKEESKESLPDKEIEISRSRSQEIYLQRKTLAASMTRKKFGLVRTSQDLDTLKEKIIDAASVDEEEDDKSEQNKDKITAFEVIGEVTNSENDSLTINNTQEIENKLPNKLEDQIEQKMQDTNVNEVKSDTEVIKEITEVFENKHLGERPSSTDGQKKLESLSSSNGSLHTLRHSRSFDSGLPMSPEVRRRLKASLLTHKSPSEISIIDVKRLSNTTTPSPGRQSIEDLANSVENLREKLLLFPFGRSSKTPFKIAEDEEEDQITQLPLIQGGLTRSRSWQGFGAAHRAARHQAFWENQRYEQVTDKDLALPPPPPPKPPDAQSSNSALNEANLPPPTGRIGRIGAISRRYRPLSGSPSSSPLRYQKRSLTIPMRSPLAQAPEKSASYDSELVTKESQPLSPLALEKATSLCNLPSSSLPSETRSDDDDLVQSLSESLKKLNTSKTREQRDKKHKRDKAERTLLPGALSLDSISTTNTQYNQEFDDGRPREWSPKKKKKLNKSPDAEISSSEDESDGSSDEEFSLEIVNSPSLQNCNRNDNKESSHKVETNCDSTNESNKGLEQDKSNDLGGIQLPSQNIDQVTKSFIESQQQVLFRQHFLSIIQEEEEQSDATANTPGSSRASSRPSSIYGGLPSINANDLREMFKGLEERSLDGAKIEASSPTTRMKFVKECETKIEATINSILSDQAAKTISYNLEVPESPNLPRSSPESLKDILKKLPPPPKQPPSIKPLWSPDRRKKFIPDIKNMSPNNSVIAEEHALLPGEPMKLNHAQNSYSNSSSLLSISSIDNLDENHLANRSPSLPPKSITPTSVFNNSPRLLRNPLLSPKLNERVIEKLPVQTNKALIKNTTDASLSENNKVMPEGRIEDTKMAKDESEISTKESILPDRNLGQDLRNNNSVLESLSQEAENCSSKQMNTNTNSQPKQNETGLENNSTQKAKSSNNHIIINKVITEENKSVSPTLEISNKNQAFSTIISKESILPKHKEEPIESPTNGTLNENIKSPQLYKMSDNPTTLSKNMGAPKINNDDKEHSNEVFNRISQPDKDPKETTSVKGVSDNSYSSLKHLLNSVENKSVNSSSYTVDQKPVRTSKPREDTLKSILKNSNHIAPSIPIGRDSEQDKNQLRELDAYNWKPISAPSQKLSDTNVNTIPKSASKESLKDYKRGGTRDFSRTSSQNSIISQTGVLLQSKTPTNINKDVNHTEVQPKLLDQNSTVSKNGTLPRNKDSSEVATKTNESQGASEISLEELIKKYNGPKRQPQKQSTNEKSNPVPVTSKPPVRIRSASCNRQNLDQAATILDKQSGKFSSMKELLKNVVGSQKNVQQQKMELLQKTSNGTDEEKTPQASGASKVSRFFKSAFGGSSSKTLPSTKSSSVSQSNTSLAVEHNTEQSQQQKKLTVMGKAKSTLRRAESFHESVGPADSSSRFDSLRRPHASKKSTDDGKVDEDPSSSGTSSAAFNKATPQTQEVNVSPHWVRGGKKVPPVSQAAKQQLLLRQAKS